jgi:hypothetical protein
MSCCLYWVILEERLSVRVLASAVGELDVFMLRVVMWQHVVLFVLGYT